MDWDRSTTQLLEYCDLVSDMHMLEQELHVGIVQRYAAPRPIGRRSSAVNEDIAAEAGVLGRLERSEVRCFDLVILPTRYEPRMQARFCISEVRITDAY